MLVKNSKRREWTAQDVRDLKELAKAKTPAAQIARKLKRTEGATRQKALTLNLSLNSRIAVARPGFKKTAAKKTALKKTAAKKSKAGFKKTGMKKASVRKARVKKKA